MSRHRLAPALGLILVTACTPVDIEPTSTTSTTTVVMRSPSSVDEPTTTTAPVKRIEPGRASILDPSTYSVDSFLVPFTLEVVEDGWRSGALASHYSFFALKDPEGGGLALEVMLLAISPTASLEEVVADFRAKDRIIDLTPIESADLVGVEGVRFEGRVPDNLFFGVTLIAVGDGAEYGISSGNRFRVWVVDLGDQRITIVAQSTPSDFDRLMPHADTFIEGLRFSPEG